MCLAIPGKLIEIERDSNGVRMGKANFGGIVKQVCLEYTPEVELGDYVLVHVGFSLSRVNEEEAVRVGASWALGFTNPLAGPILVGKLGWEDVTTLRIWVRPKRLR